jgi:hypothetical protein
MIKRHYNLLMLLAFVPMIVGAGDFACVVTPSADSIVVTSPIPISGLLLDGNLNQVNGDVALNVNGVNLPVVSTTNSTWAYPAVGLNVGTNMFWGSTLRFTPAGPEQGGVAPFMLERRTDLIASGLQNVFLDFNSTQFDNLMRQIAVATLEPDPSPAQLQAFPEAVRTSLREYFDLAYFGNNVVRVPANGPNVHRINFDSVNIMPNLFGNSPINFNNTNKTQTSNVFVTTFKTSVVDENQLIAGTPAELSDTMAQRAGDIGVLIGRTAVHELGHSLGLVVEGANLLKGCEGSHNCLAFDDANPLANRFDVGHFVMDPGPRSLFFARAGFANQTDRNPRQLPVFNNYNKSYIGHID